MCDEIDNVYKKDAESFFQRMSLSTSPDAPSVEIPEAAYSLMSIKTGNESFRYEPRESDLFFRQLAKEHDYYCVAYGPETWNLIPSAKIGFTFSGTTTEVHVEHGDESVVSRIIDLTREQAAHCQIEKPQPEPERPHVFIGHGQAPDWRTLNQWLDRMGIHCSAFETLPHEGRTIERTLEHALDDVNFAILVLTGEDQKADNSLQARQNVVHELGLFQGQLGWSNALILLEDGTHEFSNIAGTHQLRYKKGEISSTFGNLALALRERFPDGF